MRTLDADIVTEMSARIVRVEYLVELGFDSSTVNLWTGLGPLTWDGKTWEGNGWLTVPGTMSETTSVRATGMSLRLSGVPTTLISLVLDSARQRNRGTVYLGFFDDHDLLIDAAKFFAGEVDKIEIDEKADDSVIMIALESPLIRLNEQRELRWSHESQRADYPDDLGFEYLTFIASSNARFYWGQEKK